MAGIPTPDAHTFWPSFELLSDWLDGLQRPLVLGGFSQGAVMGWALGLGRGPAKRPAAIVALSGFMPRVEGTSVLYHEYPLQHTIDPGFVPELQAFVAGVVEAK